MKTKSLAILIGVFVVVASTALAGDNSDKKDSKSSTAKAKDKKTEKQSGNTETYKGVKVTGSNVKQDIRKNGMITDNTGQLLVIDQQTIEKSGAVDLKQLLNKTGVH
jgi:hypothetical protein